jgi:murein DD-endopeptidase MepM/ murein hydrolase activator NlpD
VAGPVDRWMPQILQVSQKYGLNPALLAALVDFESGGDPGAQNKSSGATGLGQVMPREAGFPGRPTAKELFDPAVNLEWSARILSEGIKRWGSEDQGLAAYLGAIDGKGQITLAADANGTNGPKYIEAVRGRVPKYAGASGKSPSSSEAAATQPSMNWVWPIDVPWGSGVTNPFGAGQVRAEGTTISLPEKNVGMDIGAKLGTVIRAPVSGTVARVVRATADNYRNDNDGYGEFVVINGDDGREHLLAHMQRGSAISAGGRVEAGQPIGKVGVTGNTTGPHVNWEAKNKSGAYEDPNQFNRKGYQSGSAKAVTVQARDGSGKTFQLELPDAGEALPWEPLPVWMQKKGLTLENMDMARSWSQPYQAGDGIWHFPYTENGASGEELMSDADYRSWQTQQEQLRSAGSTSGSATTVSMPGGSSGTSSNLAQPGGPSAAALQAMFNAALQLSQQAAVQLSSQGLSPQMVWNPNAYGEGRGAFVPSGETVSTLESIAKQYDVNRTQITALAAQAQSAGRVPALRLDENGYLRQVLDEAGQPIYEETTGSRMQRQAAGTAVGYISKDLLEPPPALPANARLGPAVGQNFAGQGNAGMPTGQGTGARPPGSSGYSRPTAPQAAPSSPAPQPQQPGSTTNPAASQGQPVYSNPQANQQYPSGNQGGSVYALSTPQDSQTAGGRAADGQSFKDQGQDVIQMFVNTYGPQEAERRWLEEHNRAAGGGGGDGTPPYAAGGGLNQQLGAGVVLSQDEGDSTQSRIQRRMASGVIPGDMMTVDGETDLTQQASTVNSPSVFPQGDFQQNQSGYAPQSFDPSAPDARGSAADTAGTTGVASGQGLIQHPGTPGRTVNILEENMRHLSNPDLAPGYIPGSGTYNQYRLDQPGLFGPVGPNNVVSNLRYGLGGTGDPTTGKEVQTPDQWVQGGKLFTSTVTSNWGQTDETRGKDYIATLFLRSDTPSGIGTPAWSAPRQFWDGLYEEVQRGRIVPTARGWQLLAEQGYQRPAGR